MKSTRVFTLPIPYGKRALLTAAMLVSTMTFAEAYPVVFDVNSDFSATPTTIGFGGGAATYTFSYLGGSSYDVDAVATGGTAQVNYFSFFGQDMVVGFQVDSPIGATGYPFKAFPTATAIPFSIAEDFIGLKFTLNDGDHFGFAETLVPILVGYGFETTPDTPIIAAEQIGGVEVPEPFTLSLFGAGLVGAASMRRRRKAKASPA